MSTYPAYPPAAQPAAYPTASAPPHDPYAQPAYPPPAVGAYPPPAAYPPYPAYGGPEEVRTVFITGFPSEVKERELNNMLRFLPAYEASQMNWRQGQAQGFALFHHGQGARDAITHLHGLQFDADVSLRCELARKNMYIREDPTVKRGRYEAPYPAYGQPPASSYYQGQRASSYAPITNNRDNPPCNTLFIGNLSENISETELRALFASQPGFTQLKLNRGSGNITCFVEFLDLPTAMACHTGQQGAVLESSDRGGIRIQYSKNPYGKKRDVTGNYISTPIPGYGEEAAAAPQDPSAPGVETKPEGA